MGFCLPWALYRQVRVRLGICTWATLELGLNLGKWFCFDRMPSWCRIVGVEKEPRHRQSWRGGLRDKASWRSHLRGVIKTPNGVQQHLPQVSPRRACRNEKRIFFGEKKIESLDCSKHWSAKPAWRLFGNISPRFLHTATQPQPPEVTRPSGTGRKWPGSDPTCRVTSAVSETAGETKKKWFQLYY